MNAKKSRGNFKKYLFLTSIAIFFIVVGLAISLLTISAIEKTAGVNFCQSCHSMKPMVDSYKHSVHGGFSHSNVVAQCVDCHLPHNSTLGYLIEKIKTGTYDVWAESTYDTSKIDWQEKRKKRRDFVYDSGCLRCHKNLLRAIKLNSDAFIYHKAYFSKKLKVIDGDKKVSAKCVDCHKNVGHYELDKHLAILKVKNDQKRDTLQKFDKFITVMGDIKTNLMVSNDEYYFKGIKDLNISDKEIADINVTKIAESIKESKKEKMQKLTAKVLELERKLHEKLKQEEKIQKEKNIAEINLANKIALNEQNLTHIKAKQNSAQLIKIEDFPDMFKPLKKYLHDPFARGACLLCHIPNPKIPGKLIIKGKINNLCYECHPIKVKKKYKHNPVNEGNCMDCHNPHQSDIKYLLKGLPKEGLCTNCHDKTKAKSSMKREKTVNFNAKYIHDPVKKDCLLCHQEHTSNYKYLLKKDISDINLCINCHKKSIKMDNIRYKHGAIIDSKKGCLECHTAHTSKYKNLLKQTEIKLCLSCHDKKLKSDEDGSILINMKSYLKTHKNWHFPVKNGCSRCHNPHSSNYFSLLKSSYSQSNPKEFICYKCHSIQKFKTKYTTKLTKFRDQNLNLHFVHAEYKEGLECKVCHDGHASKYQALIRDYTDFNGVKFPLRYIKTPTGGSCLPACHKRFKYDREIQKK